MVTVKVSSAGRKSSFIVHKDFICFYSPYFKAALNSTFQEGVEHSVDLEDVEPTTFSLFINWVYRQRIVEPDEAPLDLKGAILLWLLADRLLATSLQNAAIELLDKAFVDVPWFTFIETNLVYDNTVVGSPLRKYLVARIVKSSQRLGIHSPKELLVDIVERLKPGHSYNCQLLPKKELEAFHVKDLPVHSSPPKIC
jgi:hypothetical protein